MDDSATLNGASMTDTSSLALPVVIPIVIGVALIVAVLLMPKAFFSSLASKIGINSSHYEDTTHPWYSRKAKFVETPATEKPELTFLQRHLEMLRAWRKPVRPAQPPLPLCLARPDATHQPRRPTGIPFKKWQGVQLNRFDRTNSMREFR